MFDTNATVAYVSYDTIWVKGPHNASKLFQIDRRSVGLDQAFQDIQNSLKTKDIKIILSNDISYTLSLQSSTPIENRTQALERAKGFIPEELSDSNFDWQVVEHTDKFDLLQLFGCNPELLNELITSAQKSSIKINSIRPIPSILKNMTSQLDAETYYIVWVRWEPQIILVHKNAVVHAQNLLGFNQEEFAKIKHFVTIHHSEIIPTRMYIDWPEHKNSDSLSSLEINETQEYTLDPFDFILSEKDTDHSDKKYLEILIK